MAIYEVTLHTTFAGVGSPGMNVYHCRIEGEPEDPGFEVPAQFIAAMANSVIPQLRTVMPSTVTMRWPYTVRYLIPDQPTDQWQDVSVVPTLYTGTGTGGELPERLAMLVHLQTLAAGRSGRGRKFHGPLSTSCLESNGTVVEARRAAIQSAYQALVTASGEIDNWGWGVYSKKDRLLRDVVRITTNNEFAQLSSRRY